MDFLFTPISGHELVFKANKFLFNTVRHVVDHFLPHARNNYRPHFLANRALALYSLFLVAIKVSVIALSIITPVSYVDASAITKDNILKLTNASRQEFGINLLEWNEELAKAAQAKADDMLNKGYFSHTSPDGRLPWDFINMYNYNYLTAGENLAEGFLEAESAEEAWMNSPGHRANILNSNFQEIGVGISEGLYMNKRTIFVVQMFGSPISQSTNILSESKNSTTQDLKVNLNKPYVSVMADSVSVPLGGQESIKNNTATVKSETNLAIVKHRAVIVGTEAIVTAELNAPVKSVRAVYGELATELDPKTETMFSGKIPLEKLGGKQITLIATNIHEEKAVAIVAGFETDIAQVYNKSAIASTENSKIVVQFAGQFFDLKSLENKIYLLFVGALLICLVIVIAVKRHVQHVGLIANTAFVAIFAVLLWMQAVS